MNARIVSLSSDRQHRLAKQPREAIRLLAGLGVEGDAHAGVTVQHLSRIAKDPSAPNLRQVHLIHAELFDELAEKGFAIAPGQLGENITTRGIDLLALSRGTCLQLGADVLIEMTGLRNPCHQLNGIAPGLMNAVLDRTADGSLIRKCGVMAVVVTGGTLNSGDPITTRSVPPAHIPLGPV